MTEIYPNENVENVEHTTIYEIIQRSKFPVEVTPLYISNPIIGKTACWEPLGTKISHNEKASSSIIASKKWISIRRDGKNFSSVVPKLVQLGILTEGYSVEFENIMKELANFSFQTF